jgi:hypothetical protein
MTPRHAAYMGWVTARLREHRLQTRVVYDDDGELTDRLRIILEDDTIEVIIPEPHEAWHL